MNNLPSFDEQTSSEKFSSSKATLSLQITRGVEWDLEFEGVGDLDLELDAVVTRNSFVLCARGIGCGRYNADFYFQSAGPSFAGGGMKRMLYFQRNLGGI